ncbi:thiamine transport system ATP-binding protein [Mesorhizobium sp. J18]|uniref:thiamine ABC transporter ATP-binding protein n=1 Tax=Mesorhizobium sp. J18 TaxID=935263 RepID=UPI00119A6EE8|nr:thiamine ABC transporter ATP-binding protein [Mesorhizobium sp. J18]TWG97962.1 thiamine transport system ATP-binding protein [Mesorhizobium sp. J18]
MRKDHKGTSGAAIRLDNVRFTYPGGPPMIFDLSVGPGTIVAIMGPSGSGKSTMLNLIAGFEPPSSGRILIADADVTALPPAKRPVSMVFQENNLFAHLTTAANVGLGRSPSLKLSEEDRQDITQAIARTGLAGKEMRLPHELSGGERQRVALARVLVRERPVLLLDEAFASLGPALRDEMLDLLAELHAERGMTVLMATHDPADADRVAEIIAFIDEGRVAAVGLAKDFLSGYGPDAFARYVGERHANRDPALARKRT